MAQHEEDQETTKRYIWKTRQQVLDAVLLHDCEIHDATCAIIRLAGWDVDEFVLLTLAGGSDGWK